MAEKRTAEQISAVMRKIKSKDSKAELALRKELWRRGLRYRKNCPQVFGRPDVAFIGRRIAVFCDGDFWHGRNWEERKDDFKSRRDYWVPPIERNIRRDAEVTAYLEQNGWTVLRFWETVIQKDLRSCADEIELAVRGKDALLAVKRPSARKRLAAFDELLLDPLGEDNFVFGEDWDGESDAGQAAAAVAGAGSVDDRADRGVEPFPSVSPDPQDPALPAAPPGPGLGAQDAQEGSGAGLRGGSGEGIQQGGASKDQTL